jgi:hypothetical protein
MRGVAPATRIGMGSKRGSRHVRMAAAHAICGM